MFEQALGDIDDAQEYSKAMEAELEGSAEKGFGKDQLGEMQKIIDAENVDLFDVLAHYVQKGVEELEQEKLTKLLRLRYHDSIYDAVADLGGDIGAIRNLFSGFQRYLYQGVSASS